MHLTKENTIMLILPLLMDSAQILFPGSIFIGTVYVQPADRPINASNSCNHGALITKWAWLQNVLHSMVHFWSKFDCWSLLGLSANSAEELFITKEGFTGLNGVFSSWSLLQQQKSLLDLMVNFDQDMTCRSLLPRIPSEFSWTAIYKNRKFYWTQWQVLIKILPICLCFDSLLIFKINL